MRGVLNAAAEKKKILSPLYVPTSKFLHIGQRWGKWEESGNMLRK